MREPGSSERRLVSVPAVSGAGPPESARALRSSGHGASPVGSAAKRAQPGRLSSRRAISGPSAFVGASFAHSAKRS